MDTIELYYTVCWFVLTAAFGLCVGSFLNVVIYRCPEHMSLAFPASHCPKCGAKIRWHDNIPVISWLVLGGKCRDCKAPIAFRYTFVEIANCLLWVLSAALFRNTSTVYCLLAMAASSVCLVIACIDLEHQIIMDRFQVMMACLGLAAVYFDGSTSHWSHLIGAVAGGGVFLLVALVSEKVLGREAMGGGDIKFAAVAGLFLGWQKLLMAMLIASVVASAVLLTIRSLRNSDKNQEYPFGPFLTAGFLLAMFFGTQLIQAYMGLLS